MFNGHQKGYTLVELLAVAAIMGLTAVMASLALRSMILTYRLSSTTHVLAGVIREAQFRAYREGYPWKVEVNAGNHQASLFRCKEKEWESCSPLDISKWELRQDPVKFEPGVQVGESSRSYVAFDKTGRFRYQTEPQIKAGTGTRVPTDGTAKYRVLLDGEVATVGSDFDVLADERVVVWEKEEGENPPPGPIEVCLNLGESRFIGEISIGMFSSPEPRFGYPSTVRVDVSTAPSATNSACPADSAYTAYNSIGPAAHSGGWPERTDFAIWVNTSAQYIRLTLGWNGNHIALDDIAIGDEFITLMAGPVEPAHLLPSVDSSRAGTTGISLSGAENRLFDRQNAPQSNPGFDPLTDSRVARWKAPPPPESTGTGEGSDPAKEPPEPAPLVLVINAKEPRSFREVSIGMLTAQKASGFGYPKLVRLEVAPAAPTAPAGNEGWTLVGAKTGPGDPGDKSIGRTDVKFSVDGSYQYIRLTLGWNGGYAVLDEIGFGDEPKNRSALLWISPVTGKVTVTH